MQKINFLAAAPTHPATGYGKMVAGTLAGLCEIGVEVNVLERQPEFDVAHCAHPSWQNETDLAPITLVIGSPLGWENQGWGDVYLYTMSESDRVSGEWAEAINEKCAGVLVTCPELVEIYRRSGVRVPVWDVGMGVVSPDAQSIRLGGEEKPHEWDSENAPAASESASFMRLFPETSATGFEPVAHRWLSSPKTCDKPLRRRGDFVYMTYSYGDLRKGAHLVVQAFKMLFGNRANPGVQLWIKARDAEDTWLAGCVDRRIHVFDGEISDDEWAYLLRKADCFVFPSFGEGFGLPPREATLMGTPAIATGWLGLSDIHQWGLPVRVKRLTPAYFDDWGANGRGARWAEPDVVHLSSQMRWVMANPAAAQAIAARGREYLLRYFSWGRTAERICRVIPH